MKSHTLRLSSIALCCALISTTGAAETNQFDPSKVDPAVMEKMMQEFAELAPEHELFKRMEGHWTADVKGFDQKSAEPITSKGTAEFKRLMGGRYLMQDFKGVHDGKEFKGLGISAFDKVKKKYVGVWIDNMGTGLMHTEGTFDPATKTMTETGSADIPTGKLDVRMVTKHLDDNTFTFTMFMKLPDGNERESAQITYRRK